MAELHAFVVPMACILVAAAAAAAAQKAQGAHDIDRHLNSHNSPQLETLVCSTPDVLNEDLVWHAALPLLQFCEQAI